MRGRFTASERDALERDLKPFIESFCAKYRCAPRTFANIVNVIAKGIER